MALNVAIQQYRGTLTTLQSLASTGKQGVLFWTTDTHEIYVDSGSGTGVGTAWLKIAHDLVSVNAQTGTTYTVLNTDRGKLVTFSNAAAIAVTLPQAGANFPNGWAAFFENLGPSIVTITPTTSTIDGQASLQLSAGQGVLIVSDGTNYFSVKGKTSIPATAAVAHEFVTSINSDGTANLAQPSFADISGLLSQTQLPATIGSGSSLTDIDCGTAP